MTLTTIVIGLHAAQREAAIAAALDPQLASALILEGMAPGTSHFDAFDTESDLARLKIIRIAPGCMCCVGNLTLRVTLNRLLRHPPARLFISLSNSTHFSQIITFLSQEPYDAFLTLSEVIDCDNS